MSLKDFLQLISALNLPLVLGIFTFIMMDNQHKEVMRQEARDMELRMRDQEHEK